MNKKITVTIGIPTYNAEKNIRSVLLALCRQKEKYAKINRIVVYCDASSDDTVKRAREIKNTRITVVSARQRHGFAHAVAQLFRYSRSDVLVILNDDIKIIDANLIEKLIIHFFNGERVGLVSGNPQPFTPRDFLQKAIVSSFRAYERMRQTIRGGSNEFTCDGKILALSKQFMQKIKFPTNLEQAGNVDTFLYFLCITKGFLYKHAADAKVYFILPTTVADFISWSTRNNANYYLLKKQFGAVVDDEFKKPMAKFFLFTFIEFVKNPLGAIVIFLLGIYIKYRAQSANRWFTSTWNVVQSTKGAL